MKFLFVILISGNLLCPENLFGQSVLKVVFVFGCVPTSSTSYSIEITGDKFILSRTEMIFNKREHVKRIDTSKFIHSFDSTEKEALVNIIRINRLDSIGLYQERITEWGTLWKIHIQRNSITYDIDLPNYNNPGLESLIHFIVCLIPKKELPPFVCKKCG